MSQPLLPNIAACVFDAYGTLFDVNSACASEAQALGEQWPALADLWRTKQLQYTWLRGLAGHYCDFWQVTGDALDFAMTSRNINDPALRERLLDLYLHLSPYPEVAGTLAQLKAAGLKLAILSNGSPAMLAAAVDSAALNPYFDALLSVEAVGVFKPHPSVYQMAPDQLGVRAEQICYVSANGWDAYSAKAFGMRVAWCNRFGQAPERIPTAPDVQMMTLAELPGLLGLAG